MAFQADSSRVLIEQALRTAMENLLIESVDGCPVAVRIHRRERFPQNDEEDEALSTVNDPVVGPASPITSIIEIGIPTFDEKNDTDEEATQIDFTYPITFDFQAIDEWIGSVSAMAFTNSHDLVTAICMEVSRHFKESRTFGGMTNVIHDLLQQVSAVITQDEESGGRWHSITWMVTIHVKHFKG